jgi:hypothetical protein
VSLRLYRPPSEFHRNGTRLRVGVREVRAVEEVQFSPSEVGVGDRTSFKQLADREQVEWERLIQVTSWKGDSQLGARLVCDSEPRRDIALGSGCAVRRNSEGLHPPAPVNRNRQAEVLEQVLVTSRINKRVNMWRTLLCDGRTLAALRSAAVSGRSNPAAALRGARGVLQGTPVATVPPLGPLEHSLIVSVFCSARGLPGHASYVRGVGHLFFKQARLSAPLLLGRTADRSHGKPMARCKPSRVHRALAIPLHVCQ